jgi:hypothetical protein
MYTQQPHDRINLRIPIAQHRALKRIAKQRNVTVQSLIRAGITGLTGEPDTLRRQRQTKNPK